MNQPVPRNDILLISYLTLRKAIGVLGVALPFLLVLGNWWIFKKPAIEPSISNYFYTGMSGVFVGTLWVIGGFLMSYRGYEKKDAIAGRLACVFFLGIALLPTAPAPGDCTPINLVRGNLTCNAPHVISLIHGTCATLLFLILAYFSIVLFTETHAEQRHRMTKQKKERNVIYYVCGAIILISIVAIPLFRSGLGIERFGPFPVLFFFESIAVIAFGVSWLIKGEFVLKDQ